MPDATNTTPAAVDNAAVQKMIADAIKPLTDALVESQKNQKVIADTLAADAAARAEAAKAPATKEKPAANADAGKPLTADDVSRIVTETLGKTLKDRDNAAQSDAARKGFIAEKLKDLPEPYQQKLGADASKWGEEEQKIRDAFKADLAKVGATIKDVGGNPGGATASNATATAGVKGDDKGLTPGQLSFAKGIKLPA